MLAAETHRSITWIWIVLAGFLGAAVLLWHVIANAIGTLPDDIRDRLRGSLRLNARPLAVCVAIMTWTLAYGLYSVSEVPVGSSQSNLAAGTGTGTATGATPAPGAEGAPGGDGTTATSVAGAPAAGAAIGGSTPAAGRTSAPGAPGSGTKPPSTTPAPAGVSLGAPTGLAIHDANLYSGAANTRGITNDTITVCGHAPLIYGQLLNTKKEDLTVFWNWLNANGGIFGRKVNIDLQDDQYSATGGVPAATACRDENPFFIFGALGSDVIPPVRNWAEENKELYLYGFTVKKGSENARYTYSTTISQEELSSFLGDVAVTRFAGKRVGIVWRDSNNFQPGHDAYIKAVQAKGGQVVADLKVQENQGSYTQQIIELQQAKAEVVFVLEAADAQLNIIKQGKTQQYSPQWEVFSFNIQTQTLGNDSLTPPLVGSNLAPAYECHRFDGPYASYANEIKTFEDAYAKYSPNTDLCGVAGDVAWQGWVGFKAMAALLEVCGRDCTRNRFAGVMESGYKATIGAACPVDFTADKHHGGHFADLMEAYPLSGSRVAWRNAQRCVGAP
ncbi:MAG: branched-chain amino acid transport system substrate-binding protein [Acidimicrobiaceae bacterium]|jgi:ABC-type branched-subunit amino acid transport system substrate-binding protein|nr:branched-chain amino acid transport system substrate-binding protein [Acidimicrobiaceae bacterium]